MAIFAIGFAASGDSGEVMEKNGTTYYKVVLKCEECGESPEYAYYWDDHHGGRLYERPLHGNYLDGKFYCSECIDKLAEKYRRRRGL